MSTEPGRRRTEPVPQAATASRSARPTLAFSLGGTSSLKRGFQLAQSARIAAASAINGSGSGMTLRVW